MEKEAEDIEKNRYSYQDQSVTSESTSSKLEQKLKEPKKLLFFKGTIYEIIFNKESEYSQLQIALLFDMPSEEDLTNQHKIKILIALNGLKEVVFDNNKTKEEYID